MRSQTMITALMSTGLFMSAPLAQAEYKEGPFPTTIDEALSIPAEMDGVASCEEQFAETGSYCIQRSFGDKDIYIEAYIVVDKEAMDGRFDTKEKVFDQYIDAASWADYITASEPEYIFEFDYSRVEELGLDDAGNTRYVHHHSYISKAPWPINKQKVAGTSTYTLFAQPAEGAVISASFRNTTTWGDDWVLETPREDGQMKGEGMRGQDANIHLVDLEEDNRFLIIYRTRVRLDTTLLPGLSSRYVMGSVQDILVGMFITPPTL